MKILFLRDSTPDKVSLNFIAYLSDFVGDFNILHDAGGHGTEDKFG